MNGRILILEQSPAVLDLLRQILGEAEYEAIAAADLGEVVRLAGSEQIDLLIAGTSATGAMDLLKDVKAASAEMPVLLVTEPSTAFQAAEAAQHGAFGYIQTPIDPEQLRLLVLRAIEFGRLLRENRALRGEGSALAGRPLAEIEKQVILSTLEQFKGHRLRTATALGIGLRTLGMKLKRWKDEGQLIESRG